MINAKAGLFLHSASYGGTLFILGEISSNVNINMMSGTAGPLVLVRLKHFTKGVIKLLR